MRRAPGRRSREWGGMTPMIAGLSLALAALGIGGVTFGRVVAVKQDAQRMADAAVLAAAEMIKDRGLPFDLAERSAAETLARRNSKLPASFAWNVKDEADSVEFDVLVRIQVPVARLIYPSGSTTVEARAKGRIAQSKFDTATRRYPKLVMVLDYSGSMNQRMPGGGGQSAIQVLRDSIRNLLDANLRIDYGAVFYSSGIRSVVPIGPAAPAQIKAQLNQGAGGMTCTSCGLHRARELLQAKEDTGRYVILVTDGLPNNGGGESGSRAAANTVWGIDGSIFTLHVDWSSSSSLRNQMRNFLISVSGSPASHPDAGYFYRASDAGTLRAIFEDIVANIVCSVGPLNPPPADPSTMTVFLKKGGNERAIPAVADLAANKSIEAYRYDNPSRTVRLTEAACDRVIDGGDDIVVRFGDAYLSE